MVGAYDDVEAFGVLFVAGTLCLALGGVLNEVTNELWVQGVLNKLTTLCTLGSGLMLVLGPAVRISSFVRSSLVLRNWDLLGFLVGLGCGGGAKLVGVADPVVKLSG